ncbi:MAG: hypothetical protein ABSA33_03240 [Candidatus Micrarchaeaceae archaeon]|jgi:hypothetical protein
MPPITDDKGKQSKDSERYPDLTKEDQAYLKGYAIRSTEDRWREVRERLGYKKTVRAFED